VPQVLRSSSRDPALLLYTSPLSIYQSSNIYTRSTVEFYVWHAPIRCRARVRPIYTGSIVASLDCAISLYLPYTGFTFEVLEHQSYLYIYIIFIDLRVCTVFDTARLQTIYRIDRCVSRLRNFLLTGNLPYTGFTFDSPDRPSFIIYIILASLKVLLWSPPLLYNSPYLQDRQSFQYIYPSATPTLQYWINQLRFVSFAHFIPELISTLSPNLYQSTLLNCSRGTWLSAQKARSTAKYRHRSKH
jgi:hypothetical protein